METLAALGEMLLAARGPILAASYGRLRDEVTLHVQAQNMAAIDLAAIERARRERAISARLVLRVHHQTETPRREHWSAFLASTRDEAVLLDAHGWLARAALIRQAGEAIMQALGEVVREVCFHAASQTLWVVLDRAISLPAMTPTVGAAVYFAVGEAQWRMVRLRVSTDTPPAGALRLPRSSPGRAAP
jgi:hypothetical protein